MSSTGYCSLAFVPWELTEPRIFLNLFIIPPPLPLADEGEDDEELLCGGREGLVGLGGDCSGCSVSIRAIVELRILGELEIL